MTWSAYVSDSDVWLGTQPIFPSCKHLIMCLGCTSLLRFRVWAASIKGTWIWYDGSWCFFYAFPRYWTNALLTDYLYNCGLRILFRGVVNAESFKNKTGTRELIFWRIFYLQGIASFPNQGSHQGLLLLCSLLFVFVTVVRSLQIINCYWYRPQWEICWSLLRGGAQYLSLFVCLEWAFVMENRTF